MIRATPAWRPAAVASFVLVPVLTLSAAATVAAAPSGEHIDLYQDGVAVTSAAGRSALFQLPAGSAATFLEDSRVLDPTSLAPSAAGLQPTQHPRLVAGDPSAAALILDPDSAADAAAASRDWLASGVAPGTDGPFAELGEAALLDLHALTLDNGASLAAASPHWRYVWPRDASFVAAAFARTGHVDDAVDVLSFLADVQEDDGSFHARYLPDGSGVPDDRGLQSDGVGWTLWAAGIVLDETPQPRRAAVAAALRPLVDASSEHALRLVDGTDALPPASADYWEVAPTSLTLGTAGPLLAGLDSAASFYATADTLPGSAAPGDDGGAGARGVATAAAADRLRAAVEDAFGAQGYPRHVTGGPRDASTAFVLPPFQPEPLAGADVAWHTSITEMLRPAGGLAPGAGWRDDGISWTPQTTLYALAAASSDRPEDRASAHEWLRWVDEHRTSSGAIPEKVLADGSPAAVAPLAWSSALVVLALVELDGAALPR
ncbi:glycoside hydrolase family 15 [Cellulosimicrobium terreum]|nr:glycoside hydrolase family 15 [Cellulosimicrobium terreum]